MSQPASRARSVHVRPGSNSQPLPLREGTSLEGVAEQLDIAGIASGDALAKGMEAKAVEFVRSGAELYRRA